VISKNRGGLPTAGKIDGGFDILINSVEILVNDPFTEFVDRASRLGKVL
jgi:hypothetical protein